MKMKWWLLMVVCMTKSLALWSQADSRSGMVLPIAFYLPETRWGFGAAGILNFQLSEADSLSPPSQVQLGGAYTQEKQILAYGNYNLYWSERTWNVRGELGWYKYSYFFYGVGNDVPEDFMEVYYLKFPRFRIDGIRKVSEHLFMGLRYWYDDFDIDAGRLDTLGLLVSGDIPGSQGGKSGGTGILMQYDTRDNVYNATSGFWVEGVAQTYVSGLTSDYKFNKFRLEAKYFKNLGNEKTLALDALLLHTTGDVPFTQMAMLGGSKKLRGLYEGKYRDKTLLLLQGEIRIPVWRKWGGVLFAGSGAVAPSVSKLRINHLRHSAGAGIRYMIDTEKRINLRIDYARAGKGNSGWYVTFGEAF